MVLLSRNEKAAQENFIAHLFLAINHKPPPSGLFDTQRQLRFTARRTREIAWLFESCYWSLETSRFCLLRELRTYSLVS